MSFAHWRAWGRLSLLANDTLEGAERERLLAHVAACPRCAAELHELRGVLERAQHDPARTAEPPVETRVLVQLTQARLAERLSAGARPSVRRPGLLWMPATAAAALAAVVLFPRALPLLDRLRGGPGDAHVARATEQLVLPDEALRRIENTVEREQAARYLNEAEAVLVTVAATPQHCDRKRETVDMAEERKRSRELLTRRALLLDLDSQGVRSVRPVLEDVERMLRQVATLDPCARPEDLLTIHEQMRDSRLLMKIGLMKGELLG